MNCDISMKRSILLLVLFCCMNVLSAQDKPIFLPEDIEHNTLQLDCLCKPGVVNKSRSRGIDISYYHTFNSRLEQEDDFVLTEPLSETTLQNLNITLRAPVVFKEGVKAFVGFIYRPENYDFRRIGAEYSEVFRYLDGRSLRSSGFEALFTKSWSSEYYTSFRIRSLFNGDYSEVINFDNRYAIYNVSGVFGVKKRERPVSRTGLLN